MLTAARNGLDQGRRDHARKEAVAAAVGRGDGVSAGAERRVGERGDGLAVDVRERRRVPPRAVDGEDNRARRRSDSARPPTTAAVNVTGWPGVEGLPELLIVIMVGATTMVSTRAAVLKVWRISPL